MTEDAYKPDFTLRKDGTFVDEDAEFDLERYVGRPVDEIPDETPGVWPLVDDDRKVIAWFETWTPGEFTEHLMDGTIVDPEDGYCDYLTAP
jgi:hypothetical protein